MSNKTVRAQDLANIEFELVDVGGGKFALGVSQVSGGSAGTVALDAATLTALANRGALTDRSGTITTGGTAQNAMAANASRKYARITNPISATESLWVNDSGTATAASPSEELLPGDQYETNGFAPTGAISVIAATTSHAFTAREG